MHAAVRPFITTGIALVGASVVAVNPITPASPPDDHIVNTAVQLTAVPSALEFYPYVVRATLENAGIMVQRYLAEPVPIVRALLGAEVTAPTDVLTALGRVATSSVSWAVPGALGALHAVGDVVGAGLALNPVDFVNALLNVPLRIVDSLLNGYTITWLQADVEGLLGLAGSLIALNQAIGAAISGLLRPASTALLAADELPRPAAMRVNLTTSPAVNDDQGSVDTRLPEPGADRTTQVADGPHAGTTVTTNELSQPDSNAAIQEHRETSTPAAEGADEPDEPGQPDAPLRTGRELDTSVAEAANASHGLTDARSRASAEGQRGLDTATTAVTNPGKHIRDGNKVRPNQAGGEGASSGSDDGNADKPPADTDTASDGA
ncbi:hypothetical protein ACGFK1_19100 [Mycobacterium sp. NPDC048908]|uniref:hypothetical protein n=1 Tax=Mycobacterium sp. NPDC048908 TaxID=3364292 RepID=UPI003721221D